MLNRSLLISLLVAVAVGAWGWYLADSRADIIKDQDAEIAVKDKALAEYEHIYSVFAQASEQAKDFEKELNNDVADNLDVVPADYILKQLQSD